MCKTKEIVTGMSSAYIHMKKQRGMSIVVILVILVAILLLGVAAAQISLLSSQSTRYWRDYAVARESAHSAFVDAIMDIEGTRRPEAFEEDSSLGFIEGAGCAGEYAGLCTQKDPNIPILFDKNNFDIKNSSNVVSYGTFTGRSFSSIGAGLQPAQEPGYIIERIEVPTADDMGDTPTKKPPVNAKFRISAIGFGPRTEVYVILQGEYDKTR